MPERRTGTTSGQMRNAPQGAIYIWPNNHLDYPKSLARRLLRDDLLINSPSILDDNAYKLMGFRKHLVIDHACELTRTQSRVAHDYMVRFGGKD